MCSCFCETFCCFLLRFRDTYIPNTSVASNHQSRNANSGDRSPPRELGTFTECSAGSQSPVGFPPPVNMQPRPMPTLAPLGNSWQQGRNKPLPPLLPLIKSTGFSLGKDRDLCQDREYWASPTSTGCGLDLEPAGDIGMFSVSSSLPTEWRVSVV